MKRSPVGGAADASLRAGHVGNHALLAERRRKEGRCAAPPGAFLLSGLSPHGAGAGVELHAALGVVIGRPAGFRVDALGPGHFLLILIGTQELAAGAVERIEEAVARE